MSAFPHREPPHRKRLGQFFTGPRLARLLAALGRADDALTIVDPMAGAGDMLEACLNVGAMPKLLRGVEIDPEVAHACAGRLTSRLTSAEVLNGDAFRATSWNDLAMQWDLVITNPPYVRYQSTASSAEAGVIAPSANDVRTSLKQFIKATEALSSAERQAFLMYADGYSGLSDLAVPAWLLCMMLVRPGGRLAMVVPDTWLSRDYAAPVVHALRRFFDLEFVVADSDASWFTDALVRTTLVVATRVEDKGTPFLAGGHVRIAVPARAADDASVVGKAFPAGADADHAFASWAHRLLHERKGAQAPLHATWSDESSLIGTLRHAATRHAWLHVDERPDHDDATSLVPEQLSQLMNGRARCSFVTLPALGWSVGQGLRTGANDFFYVSTVAGDNCRSVLLPDELLVLPRDARRDAIRRQAELPHDRRAPNAQSAVLVLDGYALADDIALAPGARRWREIGGDLARLVGTAADTKYERQGRSVALPELSAVRTNARAFDPRRPDEPPRFWYQLPMLADRHTPPLFIARVNAGHPIAYLNPQRKLVVDANFSTLWPAQSSTTVDCCTALALLSSTWTSCSLEASATVLGAGALKVEATHLRRLALPQPTTSALVKLQRLGEELVSAGDHARTVREIDMTLIEDITGRRDEQLYDALCTFAADRLHLRTTRRAKPTERS